VQSLESSIARPLDAALAALLDQPVGTRHVGAWY